MTPHEWEQRRKGIGSSDIPRLLGMSRYGGPWDVWAEKTGVVGMKDAETEAQRMGHVMQPVILKEYAYRYDRRVRENDACVPKVTGPSWVIATPDFFFLDEPGSGGEIKNVRNKTIEWGEALSSRIPERFYAQVQWQAYACNFEKVVLVALFGGQELVPYVIEASPEYQAEIAAFADTFWRDHVVEGNPPDPGDSETARAWVLGRYPQGVLPPRPADDAETAVVRSYLKAKDAEEKAHKAVTAARNLLLLKAGDHKGLTGPNFRVTIADTKESTYTVTRKASRSLSVHGEVL
jgi:putative phage-type endonuclease